MLSARLGGGSFQSLVAAPCIDLVMFDPSTGFPLRTVRSPVGPSRVRPGHRRAYLLVTKRDRRDGIRGLRVTKCATTIVDVLASLHCRACTMRSFVRVGMRTFRSRAPIGRAAALSFAFTLSAASSAAQSTPLVGPSRGAVMVVGGGAQGSELYAKFIELAGGPDALIIDVPTAGGDSVYPADWRGTRGLKAAGAHNVVVLHTTDRKGGRPGSVTA